MVRPRGKAVPFVICPLSDTTMTVLNDCARVSERFLPRLRSPIVEQ